MNSAEKGDTIKMNLNQEKINDDRKIEKTLLIRFRKQTNQFSEKDCLQKVQSIEILVDKKKIIFLIQVIYKSLFINMFTS